VPSTSLVFTTSSGYLSRAIRAMTRSTVSHVAIGTEIFGEPVLIHSALDGETGRTGVQITPRARWLRDNTTIAEYEIVPDVTSSMASMVRLLCERYDKLGLLGYVIVIVARWLGKKIMNPLSSSTRFVCSRYVLKLDPTGELIPEWKGLDAEQTTPQDLLQLCRSGKSFNRVTDAGVVKYDRSDP
jgi:hypothetical protein